jgi:branched-chain amino acid transport system ATP-binding protein
MSGLELRDVRVLYGPTQALKGIDVAARAGSIVTLIGPNGAGKTTALKAIMGLQHVAAGEIHLAGRRIDRLDTAEIVREGIALSPEGRRVFPEMTVAENLTAGAYLRKSRHEIADDRRSVYEYFPVLKTRERQMAGTLSGGEQQMLAIARALMARPKYLLLDEPSLGLAPLVVRAIADIVRAIHRSGVSIILVEQNARMALRLAEYAYVLESGRVVLGGPAEDLARDDYVRRVYLGAE